MSEFDGNANDGNGAVGEDPRRLRGMAMAERFRIRQEAGTWIVPSATGDGQYRVDPASGTCSCLDFTTRGLRCKHQFAVEFVRERKVAPDGTETVTEAVRLTYSQSWSVYNLAQTHEHERFLPLLRELCDGIEQPPQAMGRPRLPLADVVFALGVKTYSTLSGRRATSFVRDAAAQGFMDAAPSYNTAFRYLESPALTDLLKTLIEESAKPLAAVESNFAIDSTGIGTTTYRRWYDHKWGRERSKQSWVKVHAMTGTTTNIVTAIEATATESADTVQLPKLLARTVESFDVQELSADRAYSSKSNLHAIEEAGARGFIPFKRGTIGDKRPNHKLDSVWSRMFFYYQFKREEFEAHYHRRSNAETTFHMVKAKFGGSVRAKTPTAQVKRYDRKLWIGRWRESAAYLPS